MKVPFMLAPKALLLLLLLVLLSSRIAKGSSGSQFSPPKNSQHVSIQDLRTTTTRTSTNRKQHEMTTATSTNFLWGVRGGGGIFSFRRKPNKENNTKDDTTKKEKEEKVKKKSEEHSTATNSTTESSKAKDDHEHHRHHDRHHHHHHHDDHHHDHHHGKRSKKTWEFSLYQQGDGSEEDPDGIPTRFLKMQKYHRQDALRALNETLNWREKYKVDTILSRPHTQFDQCKAIVPHYFAGADTTNHIIFVQQPALIDFAKAALNNVELDDLITHYVYILEYCWNMLAYHNNDIHHPGHCDYVHKYYYEKTMTSIMDMTGLNLSVLRKRKILKFAGKFVSMMSAHYPQRSYKMLLLNIPKWFDAFYKVFSPLLRESTKAKMSMYSRGKKQNEALVELLGYDICRNCLPKTFFTKDFFENDDKNDNEPFDSAHLEMEKKLRDFCVARLKEAGEKMQPVV